MSGTRIARRRVIMCAVLMSGVARTSAHDEFRFVGTVVRMDIAKNLLTMKTEEHKKAFTLKVPVTDKTPIERDGKKVSRSVLKPGLTIVVDAFADDYEHLEDVRIKIVPPLPR